MKNRAVSLAITWALLLSVSCRGAEPDEQSYVPDDYELSVEDNFDSFNSDHWSRGLVHDTDPSVRMIWNGRTGGKHLLNDNYAGYILDKNAYVRDGKLYLDNVKETIQGTDPVGTFDYSTGWINSLQKINFNGTQNSVYLEVRAKFPEGPKAWPAIWLIDDSKNRKWPPEVDIWEYFGVFFNPKWGQDQMYMRFIYGSWNDKKDHSVPIDNFQASYNASQQWHVYGFQWTSEDMIWSIDGEEVHRKSKGEEVPDADWPDKTMCLVINNGLMNSVDEGATEFPNSLVLDYLAVYTAK